MPWARYLIIFFLSTIVGHDGLADRALAVMGDKTPPVTPLPEERSVVRLDLPVSWQLTRSRLMGPGAATMTESFRETWTLEIAASGRLYLTSPRARIPAYGESREGGTDMPRILIISERDLGRLVGIKPSQEMQDDDPEATAEPVGRPVTVHLLQSNKSGLDVSLTGSDEEHFALHLDVGTSTVF